MLKVTLGLLLTSMAMAVAFFAHGFATGIVLPYPDHTPARAAHEPFHHAITTALFLAAGASFAACLVSALLGCYLGLVRRRHRA